MQEYMYQIVDRDLTLINNLINPIIRFSGKVFVRYSIDNILINDFFLSIIYNFIDKKDARYRYIEQIPCIVAAFIYYIALFCLSFIIAIFKLESRESYKTLLITFGIQMTFTLVCLWSSVMGVLFPDLCMNITLFCGKKIIEIFNNNREETKKICDFIKKFWSHYRMRIQNCMLSNQKLNPQDSFNYQIRVMEIHRNLKTLSDVEKLFKYALQLQ